MDQKGNYHLFFWGGVENDGLASSEFGPERDFWFDTSEQRRLFKEKVKQFAEDHNQIVCFDEHDGPSAKKHTVACMKLIYEGGKLYIEYDSGYGAKEKIARYQFYNGHL